MNRILTEKFAILGHDLGPDRRFRLRNLCGYMEKAATLHAAELGFSVEDLAGKGLAWALAKLWLEFDDWPELGGKALDDEEAGWITIKTWPVSAERLQYRRDFLITWRGRVMARAATAWVVLNLKSRRAERMPEFITALEAENPEPVMEPARPRLPSQENAPELASFAVRESDIDRNNHVNNACFAEWLAESAPESIRSLRRLRSLEVFYRAEGRYGDTVVGRGGADAEEGVFLHGLFRLSDGRELVRGRSVWASVLRAGHIQAPGV
jgi:acyl-ACP thioesterase